ncbi:MAG: lipase family alpha/beta hydrolase [Solirubrobacterales bacterium]
MRTETAWRLPARGTAPESRQVYGKCLERELDYTSLYLRYNTGLHISENGRALSGLLDEVVARWPVEVKQISLVGHSMGGLVARGAAHYASEEQASWVRHLWHTVSLGSPHMGAPIVQGLQHLTHGLRALPETRPFGNFWARRSAGVRDLRQGSLVDEDWRDRDPDALEAVATAEVPLLEDVAHYFVTASVTRSPRHPIGRVVGDTLVLVPSASGRSRSRRVGFRSDAGMHLGGAHHMALLNHPAIYEQLRSWVGTDPRQLGPDRQRLQLAPA